MSATLLNQLDPDGRITRVHNALRGLSALAYSEIEPAESLLGRRGDLSDLLQILAEELQDAAKLPTST